jgi:hypothetical protein
MLTPTYFVIPCENIIFDLSFWFMPTFSGTQLEHKTRALCNGQSFKFWGVCRIHWVLHSVSKGLIWNCSIV